MKEADFRDSNLARISCFSAPVMNARRKMIEPQEQSTFDSIKGKWNWRE
jgi:hypothetical protein